MIICPLDFKLRVSLTGFGHTSINSLEGNSSKPINGEVLMVRASEKTPEPQALIPATDNSHIPLNWVSQIIEQVFP